MSLTHRYRNFGESAPVAQLDEELITEDIEDQKLQSFEAGYQAGWDDAVKAQSDATMKISSELGQNLQNMSFTYHEAISKLTQSLHPAMVEMVDKLLPAIARQAIGTNIIAELDVLIKGNAEQQIEIVVSPENVETVRELAEANLSDIFEIMGEPSLGQGQAFVRIGSEEKSIDLDSVISGVAEALTAFFHETSQEIKNE